MSGFRRGLIANAALDPLKMPLTLTAEEAGATVTLNVNGTLTIPGMHYRMGKSGLWLPYTAGTVLTLENIGDSCQFWNSAETLSGWTDHATFKIPKKIAASGNIQSLLNWREDVPSSGFAELFFGAKLQTLPLMPAKVLGARGYYNMFGGYATIYQKKVVLDFTIDKAITQHMFQFASGIESVELWGEITASGDLSAMFRGMTNLKEIKVHFTSWDAQFANWVLAVPSSGTFYKPSALPEEYGNNRIPAGWTVVNID